MPPESYGRLCAEFYDLDKPEAETSEVDFIANSLDRAPGPALEAMCGSGRLLIPLLRRGYVLEGVDNSPAMLANLEKRCRAAAVKPPVVYLQSVTALDLPKKYSVIFIALGSFQLLPSVKAARSALQNLRDVLTPGGMLILDTFIPWELIQSENKTRTTTRKVVVGKQVIHLLTRLEINKDEKRYRVQNTYERRAGDVLLETESETFSVTWYQPEEMIPLLEVAGFSVYQRVIPKYGTIPRRFIYECTKQNVTG